MANIIGIMGESGSGKTTSMRNLDPSTTYYIDCDKKGLSWRGWKKQYNAEAKNYYCTDQQANVLKIMQGINNDRPHIKTIVIDTLNGIIAANEGMSAQNLSVLIHPNTSKEVKDLMESAGVNMVIDTDEI